MNIENKLTPIRNEIVKLKKTLGDIDEEKVDEISTKVNNITTRLTQYENLLPDITYEEI